MAPGQHRVERIEYDPGRSAHIALLSIKEGNKINYSYIVASDGLRAGQQIESFRSGIPERLIKELGDTSDAGLLATKTCHPGNCLPLHMVPPGTAVFNVGKAKHGPAKFCRSAGTYATVIGKNEGDAKWADFVDVKLKSGEVLHIQKDCCCTIGIASNVDYNHRQLGKAGRSRWLGIRPTVRGVAMNASDHPHGGGRGKSKGNRNPVSPWGILTKGGYKTRKKSKVNRYVVKARPRSESKKAKKAKKLKKNK
ncbi:uncharacterized protein KY384_002016 [Bacidia gigantensis]|uniref:uncharacterized protein n=1 Tax=Bacidia gigantensis TaxID=2732470 RepID=UPI001D0376B9|nr:uncharacterized protein KY384_002016 [Bacidia gigantensis]KAG8533233.1 hypothetical protein KY384_002016 [Bacidia gigantensis]